MSETNGQGKSGLDRLEEIVRRAELANEAAHERFEEEDKRLLMSQILMNDAMTKMNGAMTKMVVSMEGTDLRLQEHFLALKAIDLRLDRLAVAMEETTGKLNALIDTVDGIIGDRAK